jgi:hypothetical protein
MTANRKSAFPDAHRTRSMAITAIAVAAAVMAAMI